MIAANELRIGNWVNEYGTPTMIEKGEEIDAHCNHWQPIPLTPEILEKAGFVDEVDVFGMLYRCKNIYMHFDGEALSANFGHIEQLDVEIKHLHQLQNLYFALTGKELNIEL